MSTWIGDPNTWAVNSGLPHTPQMSPSLWSIVGSSTPFSPVLGGIMSTDLDREAYKMSVQALVDLWVTKYGNDWVDVAAVEQDEFYKHAYNRLKGMALLEVHYLTDHSKYVCRKPQ